MNDGCCWEGCWLDNQCVGNSDESVSAHSLLCGLLSTAIGCCKYQPMNVFVQSRHYVFNLLSLRRIYEAYETAILPVRFPLVTSEKFNIFYEILYEGHAFEGDFEFVLP
jgi:hypothetical protein